jgi:thiol-disulfide isomerase/thioredoxin
MATPQAPLYTSESDVQILDDASFIGKSMKIKPQFLSGPGVLKIYAPWCGFCISKVNCCNLLARSLQQHGMNVYVIDGTDNPLFGNKFQVRGYPTFLEVSATGLIGGPLKDKSGTPVNQMPDIVSALCGNTPAVCSFIKDMENCQK